MGQISNKIENFTTNVNEAFVQEAQSSLPALLEETVYPQTQVQIVRDGGDWRSVEVSAAKDAYTRRMREGGLCLL